MELDYPHTCPVIDNSIESLKSDIKSELSNMLDECCPMIKGEQKEGFINYYVQRLYRHFEDNFEDVRKTNEAIRDAANIQIRGLEDELANAKKELVNSKEELAIVQEELANAREELAKAEAELDELQYTIEQLEANNKATD